MSVAADIEANPRRYFDLPGEEGRLEMVGFTPEEASRARD